MRRIYAIRSKSISPNSSPELDHVHLDIACVARRMQWIIKHSCINDDEPVHSDECVEHILKEMHDLLMHIKDLGGSLGHLDCHEKLRQIKAMQSVHDYLDGIAHEIDNVHDTIRHLVAVNEDKIHDYGHHVYGGVKSALKTVCARVMQIYHEFLKKMHDLGLLDRDLMVDLHID